MKLSKVKIVFCAICFLCVCVAIFTIKKGDRLISDDKLTPELTKEEIHEDKLEIRRSARPDTEISEAVLDEPKTSDDVENLIDLEGIVETDISTLMDMNWNSRVIDSHFTDRNKVADVIKTIPIKNRSAVSEEQLNVLRSSLIEMIFDNGRNDFDSYLRFMRKTGEEVAEDIYKVFREILIEEDGIPEGEVAADSWELAHQFYKENKSRWQGLVSDGSEIRVFETSVPQLDEPGKELKVLRGAVTTFRHITNPPITLGEALKAKKRVLIADAKIFIAHEDEMGGIVRPYVIRYWFDPVNDLWRPLAMSCFQNRFESFQVDVIY